jgi:hypothetical protein
MNPSQCSYVSMHTCTFKIHLYWLYRMHSLVYTAEQHFMIILQSTYPFFYCRFFYFNSNFYFYNDVLGKKFVCGFTCRISPKHILWIINGGGPASALTLSPRWHSCVLSSEWLNISSHMPHCLQLCVSFLNLTFTVHIILYHQIILGNSVTNFNKISHDMKNKNIYIFLWLLTFNFYYFIIIAHSYQILCHVNIVSSLIVWE